MFGNEYDIFVRNILIIGINVDFVYIVMFIVELYLYLGKEFQINRFLGLGIYRIFLGEDIGVKFVF